MGAVGVICQCTESSIIAQDRGVGQTGLIPGIDSLSTQPPTSHPPPQLAHLIGQTPTRASLPSSYTFQTPETIAQPRPVPYVV